MLPEDDDITSHADTSTELSVVIPAYNAVSFVEARLDHLLAGLDGAGLDHEVIVVNDGSTDETGEICGRIDHPRLRVIDKAVNEGKFAAIRSGMAEARGTCRIYTDADIPYDLSAIPYAARLVNGRGLHVVIGDRSLPGSKYRDELGLLRGAATRLFTLAVRLFVTSGLGDTQCGFKAIRGDVADVIFPLTRECRFAGDVELLYLSLMHNLEIKRIPVRLKHQGPSSVRAWRDARLMLTSLFRVRVSRSKGRYVSSELDRLSQDEAWFMTRKGL